MQLFVPTNRGAAERRQAVIIEANIDPSAVAALSRDMQDELEFAAMGMQAARKEAV